jgi:DNA-binding response OmpR family regulator
MAKILIYDDDTAILDVLKIVLEDNGFEVFANTSADGAVDDVRRIRPEIILLDIWMQGASGDVVTKALKQDKFCKKIPVIVVSANRETEKIAHQVGADGFMVKPFDIDQLLSLIKTHLAKG